VVLAHKGVYPARQQAARRTRPEYGSSPTTGCGAQRGTIRSGRIVLRPAESKGWTVALAARGRIRQKLFVVSILSRAEKARILFSQIRSATGNTANAPRSGSPAQKNCSCSRRSRPSPGLLPLDGQTICQMSLLTRFTAPSRHDPKRCPKSHRSRAERAGYQTFSPDRTRP